jgi:hypothetical protein
LTRGLSKVKTRVISAATSRLVKLGFRA